MTGYILVPLDGSGPAENALPLHIKLARLTSSGINLLRVVPAPAPGADAHKAQSAGVRSQEIREERLLEREAALDYVNEIAGRLQAVGVTVRCDVIQGAPA